MKALISMNYFTDSASFQAQLEGPIDKRSGKIFGPPTGKKLVYFVDDINLPYIEDYGTQNSLSLMRQSQGKYSSEGAAREWSTVVKISIPPPSFKSVPLSLSRYPLL